MKVLLVITALSLLLSFFADRKKTFLGLKKAWKKFIKILVPLTAVLMLVAVVLYFIPESMISDYLIESNRFTGVFIASLFGSVTMMPGFIAFPLSGILRQNNVPYMVISAFTSTLMMVGVLTFPIEKSFFGTKVSIVRNIVSIIIALIVSVITGIFFGEIMF